MFGVFKNSDANIGAAAAKVGSVPRSRLSKWSAAAPAAKVSSSLRACGMDRSPRRQIRRLCKGRYLRFAAVRDQRSELPLPPIKPWID
ncbi:hypothetical protein [Phaeobacter gallaeciensis]|uniref:hypothetical protein n=1 Tax=Phaeobacter gallaeciensis TaxID=60890 RepID=UPI00237F2D85|nr:hypothetical protein [Phaeobacter gallaeciensis]MDE4190129.1 hypothetical protein [Phaeobacter gallaeciensis]MDE4198378.1 hypothetical protein [Phaeobacter gallaeciensis]MDE4202523.1 hypothetical protein [Phaeobacter gallaeciensis]MDE4206181.1 hypothetical protein [Phaeobacter gallaeciensis]MDE4214548.1 hypothetical protein [Phaeobacter gallaeciensis]